jgi:hypothetical protein
MGMQRSDTSKPDITKIISIDTTSASGPKRSMPIGIRALVTIENIDKTLPMKAGSTVVCNKTIAGVL